MEPKLDGFLLKAKSGGGGYNRRYFYVEESRGTLAYAKSKAKMIKQPSAVLPIADISKITRADACSLRFVVSCPPIHLTLEAASHAERERWINQLELRRAVWTVRQLQKVPVANVAALIRQASGSRTELPPGAIAGSTGLPAGAPAVGGR